MITIRTSTKEHKTSAMLAKILQNEGYTLSENYDLGMIHAHKPDRSSPVEPIVKIAAETARLIYDDERGKVYKHIIESVEKPVIEFALERAGGNQLKAAKALGINRNTLRNKIKRLSIDTDRWKQRS